MNTNRTEAFSDGVMAVALTLMVLGLTVPTRADFAAFATLLPGFLTYVLSFVYIGIYWNNHHHLLQATEQVSGAVLWANLHLLFWITLIPLTTAWVSAHHAAAWPTAVYGFVLLAAAVAFFVLVRAIVRVKGANMALARAMGMNWKNIVSVLLYAIGIAAAFWQVWVADSLYVLVAAMWLVPDRRIERYGVDEDD